MASISVAFFFGVAAFLVGVALLFFAAAFLGAVVGLGAVLLVTRPDFVLPRTGSTLMTAGACMSLLAIVIIMNNDNLGHYIKGAGGELTGAGVLRLLEELAEGVVAFGPLVFFLLADALEAEVASLPGSFSFLGPRLAGVFLSATLEADSLAAVTSFVAPLGRPTEVFLGAVVLVAVGDNFYDLVRTNVQCQ